MNYCRTIGLHLKSNNQHYLSNTKDDFIGRLHQDYLQAKSTWDILTAYKIESINDGSSLPNSYFDQSYLYSLLLWNCAQQILLNKVDVYNDTIDEFILGIDDTKYSDERTQPLFKLISILMRFEIN